MDSDSQNEGDSEPKDMEEQKNNEHVAMEEQKNKYDFLLLLDAFICTAMSQLSLCIHLHTMNMYKVHIRDHFFSVLLE